MKNKQQTYCIQDHPNLFILCIFYVCIYLQTLFSFIKSLFYCLELGMSQSSYLKYLCSLWFIWFMIFALSQAKWIPIQYKKLLQMQFSAKIKTSNIYDPEHQVLFHCSENFIFSFMREWTHAIQFNDLNELLFKFKDFILTHQKTKMCFNFNPKVTKSSLQLNVLEFNFIKILNPVQSSPEFQNLQTLYYAILRK